MSRRPPGRRGFPGSGLAATAWRRWFLDRQVEFWLGELRATWSLAELRARVVEVIEESPDTRTIVLAPNRRWPGHRAGQYVPVELELDGVRVRRCYSISSGASDRTARRIAITVKRVPGGRVSSFLHAHLRVGAVVRLGEPAGDFVIPAPPPAKLLLVAGGSGITPIIAIARDLATRGALADVVVIHAARTDAAACFGRELAALATTTHGLRVIAQRAADGRLTAGGVHRRVPDLAEREIYVCGPPGLMEVITEAALAVGAGARVHRERFVASRAASRTGTAATIRLAHRSVAIDGDGTLLEHLERAGERPAHGCRMGICHSCRCRKVSGTVEDIVTGAISSEPDQEIRLCVSIARSDLELAS
jgi:ferredoxin-NADP reductase